jgi:hypothetical protein
MVYGLLRGAVSLFAASILMDSLTITALALQLGAILAAMLISEQPGRPWSGAPPWCSLSSRGALLLMAGWATGGQSSSVNPVTLTYIVGICVTVSVSLYLAIFPFHIWLPPAYRGATIVGVMLMVVVSTATLAQLSTSWIPTSGPGGAAFSAWCWCSRAWPMPSGGAWVRSCSVRCGGCWPTPPWLIWASC